MATISIIQIDVVAGSNLNDFFVAIRKKIDTLFY